MNFIYVTKCVIQPYMSIFLEERKEVRYNLILRPFEDEEFVKQNLVVQGFEILKCNNTPFFLIVKFRKYSRI